jgi:hypothetical protein
MSCDRVPRLLTRLVVDYFAYAVCPGASAPLRLLHLWRASGCLGSSSTTSPTPCDWVHRLPTRLVVDYFAYTARLCASARHAAHRRLLRLVVQPVVNLPPSRHSTSLNRTGSRRAPSHSVSRLGYSSFGCTGSTAPMTCIRTRRLAARLLVGRSHWLSSCARSLCLTARLRRHLTCCPVAPALRQPCRAPRVLATRLHGLYVNLAVRREYLLPGCIGSMSTLPCTAATCLRPQRLYIDYVVCLDYLSLSRSGSTSTTPCVRVHRLATCLLVGRSHWLLPCARSLHHVARLHRR